MESARNVCASFGCRYGTQVSLFFQGFTENTRIQDYAKGRIVGIF
jgi:hypothetical protein